MSYYNLIIKGSTHNSSKKILIIANYKNSRKNFAYLSQKFCLFVSEILQQYNPTEFIMLIICNYKWFAIINHFPSPATKKGIKSGWEIINQSKSPDHQVFDSCCDELWVALARVGTAKKQSYFQKNNFGLSGNDSQKTVFIVQL